MSDYGGSLSEGVYLSDQLVYRNQGSRNVYEEQTSENISIKDYLRVCNSKIVSHSYYTFVTYFRGLAGIKAFTAR